MWQGLPCHSPATPLLYQHGARSRYIRVIGALIRIKPIIS
jgi:hypothetical protein